MRGIGYVGARIARQDPAERSIETDRLDAERSQLDARAVRDDRLLGREQLAGIEGLAG